MPHAEATRLSEYRRKRRLQTTPEPAGAKRRHGPGSRFVVHEHRARRIHWDLRLERDGALASWAVPNGIPTDPKRNRKAIHVEDHPLEYLDFQGTIPAGSYGAGEVAVWDSGTYACQKWEPTEVIVDFYGGRLRGRYALFQAGKAEKDWMIHRMDPPSDPTAKEMPELVAPMLARASRLPQEQSEWGFEVKWDGVRALAHAHPGRLRLLSRNGNDVTAAYPELRKLAGALGSHEAILDGEIIAFDEHGKPSFEALQSRIHLRGESAVRRKASAAPVTYVIFDLLWLDGHSLMELPYTERRARLHALGLDGQHWRTPAFHRGEGTALLEATREQGLEGVVAKRLSSRYWPGRRSENWLKIKNSRRQEVVIGGWTEGKGSRAAAIGALQVGVHQDGALRYAGRVGTGFDAETLERLAGLLAPLEQADSPFAGRQPPKGAHFVQPSLVCEAEFAEWTRDGLLRHPSYKGLRQDKSAAEVVQERIEAPPRQRRRSPSPPPALTLAQLIEHGRHVRDGVEIEIDGRALKLTNLEKVLYPQTGFTKGEMIDYYAQIAPILIPHLAGRPLTLKRYPDGVQGKHFYQKQCPPHSPSWLKTAAVPTGTGKRQISYCLCEDVATLVWMANLAALELHPSLARAGAMQRPTSLAFDLDPGTPAGIVECCQVALQLRDMFAELGIRAFAKTSGLKGLQVYVPLNNHDSSYEQTKPFAHAVANLLRSGCPELVVSQMAKAQRAGKILIDWSQNDEHKTTISAYSLRAAELPSVSAPLSWDEVQECLQRSDATLLRFGPAQVLQRVQAHADLFAEVLSLQQQLPALAV